MLLDGSPHKRRRFSGNQKKALRKNTKRGRNSVIKKHINYRDSRWKFLFFLNFDFFKFCLNLSSESNQSNEGFSDDEPQDEFKTDDSDFIDEEISETETELTNKMKIKFNIRSGTDLNVMNENFVDTELIKKLIFVFLGENKVSKVSFAKYILKVHNSRFDNRFRGNSYWNNRTSTVKRYFNKIKKNIES